MGLADHVADHVALGCHKVELGIQRMPEGYALMLDADDMYYYWLRDDGTESVIHWNKWAVRKGAVQNSKSR